MPRTLTTEEVADRYSTTPDVIRRWIRQGRLEAIDIGDGRRPTYRVYPEALDRFDAANRTTAALAS